MNLTPFLIELRKFVGTKVVHQGVCCHLLEVLADGPWLVLEDCEANTSIQENQYGGLWRRVPRTYTIPVVTADGAELHPQFLALNLAISPH